MTPAEIQRHAAALSGLPAESPAWLTVQAWLADKREEAVGKLKGVAQPAECLKHWAGAIEALDDLREDLEDLRSGAWKQWPSVAGHIEDEKENE